MRGLLDIKYAISRINDPNYQNLFRIALASILLSVRNVYRNGKCLSYKKKWKENINFSRTDVHNTYIDKLRNTFRTDIEKLELHSKSKRGPKGQIPWEVKCFFDKKAPHQNYVSFFKKF